MSEKWTREKTDGFCPTVLDGQLPGDLGQTEHYSEPEGKQVRKARGDEVVRGGLLEKRSPVRATD